MPRAFTLEQLLFSQGFGTRKRCRILVLNGAVTIAGAEVDDPEAAAPNTPGTVFTVEGETWHYHPVAYLMLNKPAGYECSQKPKSHPPVYDLLPVPLRERNKGSVQAVGRLDQDTTGLLLLSDDGKFIHRMTSPKHEVGKVYEVTTAEPVTSAQVARLLAGVVLGDDPDPVAASACMATSEYSLSLTLTSGKYHQVKRMLAAAGNHVKALHRSRIGQLSLPADLREGEWRWLSADDLKKLDQAA
ncbi:MAG: pseudouridine synthase [Betaproteobacteria bacterium]|nr:pseudouridine synthase [Betaproteobacteria bacterium]